MTHARARAHTHKESHQRKLKLSLKYIQHQRRHSRPQGKILPYTISKWLHVHKKEKPYNGALYLSIGCDDDYSKSPSLSVSLDKLWSSWNIIIHRH